MAASTATPSLAFLSVFVLLFSFDFDGTLMMASAQKTWCVAKPSSSNEDMKANMDYACAYVDCEIILSESCPCSTPATPINQASITMNLYYQKMGRNQSDCDFRNSSLIVVTDPSYGDCHYQYAEY